MRNIKSAAMLSAAAIGLLYMTACSSEVKYEGEDNNLEVAAQNYSYTVHASDPSRIHNYGNGGTRATVNDPSIVPTKQLSVVGEIKVLNFEGEGILPGDISATCLNFDEDGNVYVSYHLKDEGSKGMIEVIKNIDGVYKACAYMQADKFDFNHIIVDGEYILAVGNNTFKAENENVKGGKGAFIGKLPADFTTSEGIHNDFKVKQITTDEVLYAPNNSKDAIRVGYVPAGDGNCVVADANNYYVATDLGYGVLTKDLKRVGGTFVTTTGHSKHVAKSGNNLAVLYLNADKSVTVKKYDLTNNKSYVDVLATYDKVGFIGTTDEKYLKGKNTVAIDGTTIYACLSDGGLVQIKEDGSTFKRTFGNDQDMPVNGVAVDTDYVYVAVGSFVYVLDKKSDDLKSVCHYTTASADPDDPTKKSSANYVALNNGRIYVAYGKDGVKVFELTDI